jgi:hypothetical protein
MLLMLLDKSSVLLKRLLMRLLLFSLWLLSLLLG